MKYYLSVLTMLHNDARYMKEFLEYYLLMGVEHFYLYDHQSTDHTDDVLRPYILKGLVTYVFIPDEIPGTALDSFLTVYYTKGVEQARGESQWLAIIDSDEFLVPKRANNLSSVLRSYESFGGLAANWQMFGTSGVEAIPVHGSMLALLNRKAPQRYHMNQHVKVIVQPLRVKAIEALHQAVYEEGYWTVDTGGQKIEGPFNPQIPVDVLQINHYFCRDRQYFRNVKLPRRAAYGTDPTVVVQWEQEMNAVYDGSMQRFLPHLVQRLELNRFPPYYSWRFYTLSYPDLIAMNITTEEKAAQHWLAYGQKERRQAAFDWRRYLRLNNDLVRAGVNNEEAAIRHWLARGRRERRPR
jgi:hypothetical protein